MVERNQKADGEYSMENEKKKKKKMVQIGDLGSQMLLLPSLILDTRMRQMDTRMQWQILAET